MPGVPSSKSCNACRKQKKKCDLARPACSRCARLGIACVGAGQQRYKFHNQTVDSQQALAKSPAPPRGPRDSDRDRDKDRDLSDPRRPAHHPTLPVNSQLVSALQVTDPRFDLSVYGDFLRHMPRRYGQNPTVDAALDAFSTVLPLVLAGSNTPLARPTPRMLGAYGRALYALRLDLSGGTASAETLCALYLVVVCQGWLRHDDIVIMSHGEAVASILSSMRGRTWAEDSFESSIVTTLLFLVIMESFINPRIRLDPHLWNLPESFGPLSADNDRASIDSLSHRRLVRTVALIRTPHRPGHARELLQVYGRIRADSDKLAAMLAALPFYQDPSPDDTLTSFSTPSPLSTLPHSLHRLHIRLLTGHGMLLLIALRINSVLQRQPHLCAHLLQDGLASHVPLALQLDAHLPLYVRHLVRMAEQGLPYRPLGSGIMPLYLLAAYSALPTDDVVTSRRIRCLLSMYRTDLDLDAVLARMQTPDKSTGTTTSSAATSCYHESARGLSTAVGDVSPLTQSSELVESSTPAPRRSDICCIL